MGNSSSSERATTLSRDTYFFITEDVQDRLKLAENRQLGIASSAGAASASASSSRSSSQQPTLSESVADSIRQTQMIDRLQREYEDRIAQLEQRSHQRFQSAAGQFSAAVNQVESKFVDRDLVPACCQAEKDAMAQCYAANGRYPLRCSPVVAAFEQCVTEQRRAFVLRQQRKPANPEAA